MPCSEEYYDAFLEYCNQHFLLVMLFYAAVMTYSLVSAGCLAFVVMIVLGVVFSWRRRVRKNKESEKKGGKAKPKVIVG